jgi:lysophospholipase L1-like esterase
VVVNSRGLCGIHFHQPGGLQSRVSNFRNPLHVYDILSETRLDHSMNSYREERPGHLPNLIGHFEAPRLTTSMMTKLGLTLIIFGGGMILLSSATTYLRSTGHLGVNLHPVLFVLCGVTLLFMGLLFLASTFENLELVGQRISALYRGLGTLTLNVFVVFVCLDLGVRVIDEARESIFPALPEPIADIRANSPYYRTQPWAAQYWREMVASRRNRYQPHVLWRRAPMKGQTINVDEQGIRLTPGAECTAGSFKVFAFGGSTMWGTGAPDWATIPAYLQSSIKPLKDGPVCVVNFGESGFTSTQSVIELMVQLQAGNIPDVTIFFDGVNDVYVAYQSGRPGVNENNDQLAARFERRDVAKKNPIIALLELSSLHDLAVSLVTKLRLRPVVSSAPKIVTYQTKGIDPANLANSIVQTYRSNYKIVGGLAQRYGFKSFFFWPPYIGVGKKALTPDEVQLKRTVDPALSKLHLLADRKIELLAPQQKNLLYLGGIFDGYQPLLWLDDVHVTPEGNKLIAQRMLQVMKDDGALGFDRVPVA